MDRSKEDLVRLLWQVSPNSHLSVIITQAHGFSPENCLHEITTDGVEYHWDQTRRRVMQRGLRDGDWTPSEPKVFGAWEVLPITEKGLYTPMLEDLLKPVEEAYDNHSVLKVSRVRRLGGFTS